LGPQTILALTKTKGSLNPERNPQLKKQLNEGMIFAISYYDILGA
jgi:hypothetical protein